MEEGFPGFSGAETREHLLPCEQLADITHRVPEIVDIVLALPAHDLILDGGTLALDEGGEPRPFQQTMSRFGADVARDVVLRPGAA